MRITFTIPGAPFGKQRPKFSTRGGFAKAYTPKETVSYENLVKLEYERQCAGQKFADDAEIMAEITAYFPIPKSASKKAREAMDAGSIRPTKKPDCDNIAKTILDALNNIAYTDDKQIVLLQVGKFYREEPCVIVCLLGRGEEKEE